MEDIPFVPTVPSLSNTELETREEIGSTPVVPAPSSNLERTRQSPLSVQCPPGADTWLRDSLERLSKVKLGGKFEFLLQAFVSLEAAYGFNRPPVTDANGRKKKESSLPPDDRPPQVAQWIKVARKTTPVIKDVALFQSQWRAWWDGLQPEWRGNSANGESGWSDKTKADWGVLVVPGINGLLSVVSTLYWWGCAEKAAGELSEDWGMAVEEVECACYGLKAAAQRP
ncbi:hypothetical protein FB45DRAFT_732160 [Roridomyces roridus]|uniref:Uncharacterized protein n=1 Tax=Roridomyces roridus TaxID=1738132 RepID=A0AAD7CJ21_9AGAR|nr:hypothetical protein FB45DRAFT_732160 [Roridomyces roridus]